MADDVLKVLNSADRWRRAVLLLFFLGIAITSLIPRNDRAIWLAGQTLPTAFSALAGPKFPTIYNRSSGSGLLERIGVNSDSLSSRPRSRSIGRNYPGIADSDIGDVGNRFAPVLPVGPLEGTGGLGGREDFLDASLGGVNGAGANSFLGFGAGSGGGGTSVNPVNNPGIDTPGGGTSPDGNTISPVPESSVWAMMLVGFGVLGMLFRQRKIRLKILFNSPVV